MAGPDFFQTTMGARFFEATMPSLVRGLERLNKNLEKLVEKQEEKKVEVWLVRWDHRHGTDIWAEATEEEAWSSVIHEVRGSLSELCDETKETLVERLLDAGTQKDMKEGLRLYCEAAEEEFEVWKNASRVL